MCGLKSRFLSLTKDREGAVTIDWVVITAIIVSFGTGLATAIAPDIRGQGTAIGGGIQQAVDVGGAPDQDQTVVDPN